MFSRANPFEESVTAATNENLTVENWELILAVTDKLSRATTESARDCIAAVEKRLNNKNSNVQLYTLALSEALVKNCDITVHREISSRSFTNTLTKLVHDRSIHAKVRLRILEFIQMCSFEFRADSTLGLMNEVYQSLRAEGIQFPSPQKPKKEFTQSELDKQKEEEELQLALALSLSESENRRSYKTSASNATTASTNQVSASAASKSSDSTPQISRVRALYDFQPTEQGELGFEKGDIIRVIESVYRDWWKGELRGKTGIFPVNYVEKIVDPSPSDLLKEAATENEVINETRNIDRLLEMLSSADSQSKNSFSDDDELQNLYNSTLSIRPKLVKLIEKYSLKKDELVALNEKFMQARTMYDSMLSNSIARYSNTAAGQSPVGANYGYSSYGNYGYQPNPSHNMQSPHSQPQQPQQQLQYQQPQQQPHQQPQQQPQQPSYDYPSQSKSPVAQHQPQRAYSYEQNTPQSNTANLPEQLQQQPSYDYTSQQPQQSYAPSYDNYQAPPPQQPQQPEYGYSTAVPSTPAQGHTPYSTANQPLQQQGFSNSQVTHPEGQQYPPTQYTTSPPPQQPYSIPQSNTGYPQQPQQQSYNY
ncbi:hypothetical protein EDC96DRAFT_503811 [Choanephora cucurbitarum]|nr:hypothetical protein EDC96DRAFT_503811 [Choanephora cucurbitarum]